VNRPSATSPEFRAYLLDAVTTSRGLREAADRMGYRTPGTVRYHMKKFGIKSPSEWARRPHLRLVAQGKIPVTAISLSEGKSWVAALLQGEGCIQSIYRERSDSTYLQVDIGTADPAPIFRLSDYLGIPTPKKPSKNHQWMPLWRKSIAGLRALRVLQETLPFLAGQKQKEAEKALSFFSPGGYHRGCFRNGSIWPREDFPLRTKRRGSDPQLANIGERDSISRLSGQTRPNPSNQQGIPDVIIATLEDRSWVGGFLQGEGCIQSHYAKASDFATIDIAVGLTDSAPVFKFADLCNLGRPSNSRSYNNYKPAWTKHVTGVRALRILGEIIPFLVGGKLAEAERALDFFGPDGYHKGHFRPSDIWPAGKFPFRKRHFEEQNQSL